MFQSEKQKKLSKVVFGIYVVLLVWLILFKLELNIFQCFNLRREINLIPYSYIANAWTNVQIKETVYNILIFVPLGTYVAFFKKEWNVFKKIGLIAGISLAFEILQFIFGLGGSDITDIINNTLGGAFGLLFASFLNLVFKKNSVKIVNAVGLTIEIIALGLYVYTTAWNMMYNPSF